MNRPFLVIFMICFVCGCSHATGTKGSELGKRLADSFDIGVTLGTTGIGIEASASPSGLLRVRAGVDYTPRFNIPMRFNVASYRDGSLATTDFGRIQELVYEITGFNIDPTVQMDCHARMVNFKFLVDFTPLRNKHWYVTAGFYWGSSKVGSAINAREESPSLVSINIFNHMRDRILATDFIEEPIYGDMYLDPDAADKLKGKMNEFGRIGIHVGDYPDGKPYLMEPDEDGTVRADLFVNSFKPYLGLGYKTSVGRDKRINIGVDAGALFWGGTPRVVTHENVDLAGDVDNIAGKVGRYVSVAKGLKVYPVLNFRIAWHI